MGSLGAFVLAIATYPAVDKGYVDLFLNPDPAEWLGFSLRIVGLTGLGAIWGYIHRPEHDAKRAFQLGMVAPATIAGLVYANAAGLDPGADQAAAARAAGAATVAAEFSVITRARAADGITILPLPRPTSGPTFIERLVKGAFGR